mgnify:CR=1 FL=1
MRTLVALLILLSISFNAQANHNETIDTDTSTLDSDKRTLKLYVYNKSSYPIAPWNYLWKVVFKNGDERIFKTLPRFNDTLCGSYSACTWKIDLGIRTDFKEFYRAH